MEKNSRIDKRRKSDFDKSWENCQNYYFNVVGELGQIICKFS